MNDDRFLKKTDLQKIAREGAKIYNQIEGKYDPKERGKFLAIEIESKKVYLGKTSADALNKAKQNHPNKVFYVIKIGFEAAETVAKSYLNGGNKKLYPGFNFCWCTTPRYQFPL